VFEDPQVIARQLVVDVDHPTLGTIRTLDSAIKLSATPPDVRRRAPLLAEHTQEVLAEEGLRIEDRAVIRLEESGHDRAARDYPAAD